MNARLDCAVVVASKLMTQLREIRSLAPSMLAAVGYRVRRIGDLDYVRIDAGSPRYSACLVATVQLEMSSRHSSLDGPNPRRDTQPSKAKLNLAMSRLLVQHGRNP